MENNNKKFYQQKWFQDAMIAAGGAAFGYTVAGILDEIIFSRRQRRLEKFVEAGGKIRAEQILLDLRIHKKCLEIADRVADLEKSVQLYAPLTEYREGGIIGEFDISLLHDEIQETERLIVRLTEEKLVKSSDLIDLVKYYFVLQNAEAHELNWIQAKDDFKIDRYYTDYGLGF